MQYQISIMSRSTGIKFRGLVGLEVAFTIYKIPDAMKIYLLLHHIGQDTYNVICDKIAPAEPQDQKYDEIIATLRLHFDPKPLEIVENYRFHLRKQQEGETIEDYLVALRKLSIHCNFGTYLDTALRNQLVFGVRSQKILNRLLEIDPLTLAAASAKASAMELSERGGAEIHKNLVEKVQHLEHKK